MNVRVALLALFGLLAALGRAPAPEPVSHGRATAAAASSFNHDESARRTERADSPGERGTFAPGSDDGFVPPTPPSARRMWHARPRVIATRIAAEAPATVTRDARSAWRAARPRSHVPRMQAEPPRA